MAAMGSSASEGLSQEETCYAARLSEILGTSVTFPRGRPCQVLDFLYLGSGDDASNVRRLREIGINHVVNCASGYIRSGPAFYGEDVKYLGFNAEDDHRYNIMKHFEETFQFIENARKSGGKVLIHCIMGVNRSGALAAAYVMCHEKIGPIKSVRKILNARKCVLTNEAFQHQLIKMASHKGMLTLDKDELIVSCT